MAFYRIALPARVQYHQRRAFYRVRIGMGLAIPVLIGGGDLPLWQGRLHDLSVGGIGARLERDARFSVGDTLSSCVIQFPRGTAVSSGLEIRFSKLDENYKQLHIGGRFIDLNSQQRKLIERSVAELERELIRKMPRDF